MRARALGGVGALAAAAALAAGCGGQSSGYERSLAAGDRAKSSGRYDEAARAYHDAAVAAKRPFDRDEGLFLEAETYAQAGRPREAMAALDRLAQASPRGDRTERALYDRAFLEIEHGDAPAGYAMLERTLREHPRAGSARRALRKIASHLDESGPGKGRAWLEENARGPLGSSEVGEDILYLVAQSLREEGKKREARDAYVRCAERYTYPQGGLNDNAWWNASLLDEELGDAAAAVRDLGRMLAPREASTLGQGSYERPLYSPAQFRMGELYRDKLGDPAAARRAFHALYAGFPTSLLRAPALWNEGLLAKKAGDEARACGAARDLARDLPESRYASCVELLCPSARPPDKAPPCRDYVREATVAGKPAEAPSYGPAGDGEP